MNNLKWTQEYQWQDTLGPMNQEERGEEVYTLYLGDFLKMPSVNYDELSGLDPHIRSLYN